MYYKKLESPYFYIAPDSWKLGRQIQLLKKKGLSILTVGILFLFVLFRTQNIYTNDTTKEYILNNFHKTNKNNIPTVNILSPFFFRS
jgi:hypothetical protein